MAVPSSDPVLPPSRHPGRRARRLLILALVALGLGIGFQAFLMFSRRPTAGGSAAGPPDPRLLYAGPLQNINPAVAYVADERCTDCHADLARSYSEHSMGRSLRLAAADPQTRAATPATSSFQALGSQFHIVR